MFFWPISTSTEVYQSLTDEVKKIIVKEVAEKVYQEMKSGNYTEDAYIFKIANEIAKSALNFEFVMSPNSNSYSIRVLK